MASALKIKRPTLQNAGKCVSKSLEIQNFLGGACPHTPLESKALRALQLLLEKLLKTLASDGPISFSRVKSKEDINKR